MNFDVSTVIENGSLSLVESWGSDERIIQAARQSTTGDFKGWGPFRCPQCCGARSIRDDAADVDIAVCGKCKGSGQIPGDEKLLRTLHTNRHTSPFEMAGMIVAVQAPIFVWREWMRHRTQSYNEFSARYSIMPDLAYVPSIERLMVSGQSKMNKQSSTEAPYSREGAELLQQVFRKQYADAYLAYQELMRFGVAREVARVVLPVAQFSRGWASANLLNWLKFLTLRTADNAQWEIRQYAFHVESLVAELYPRTYVLWKESH